MATAFRSEYQITNQRELRSEFWKEHPYLIRSKLYGGYVADTRIQFARWIDRLYSDGIISMDLRDRATL